MRPDLPSAHPRPTDAGIDAPRLLQPHDPIHEQIDAGRNEAAESNENAEGMDVDTEDAMGFIGSLEPSADDCISELLLQQLGSYGRRYRRETRASCTRIVSEMYSPPRVTAELKRSKKRFRHVLPGFAFDLTVSDPADGQPWDFTKKIKQ